VERRTMRYGIDHDDDSDDEFEYPVSFNPFEPTRARALATLEKDVRHNHARQEEVITPFDRVIMATINGTLATQAPRVVGMVEPQPNAMKPTVEAPREVITPFDRMVMAYANGTLATKHQAPRVVELKLPQPTRIQEPEPKKSPRRRKFEGVNELITRKKRRIIESEPDLYATATKNEPNVSNIRVPRVVDMVEPPPNKIKSVVQSPRVIVSRSRDISTELHNNPTTNLHDNLMSVKNDKDIQSPRVNCHRENIQNDVVRYGRNQRHYNDFTGFKMEIIDKGDEWLCEIKHRLRRWIAKVKMKPDSFTPKTFNEAAQQRNEDKAVETFYLFGEVNTKSATITQSQLQLHRRDISCEGVLELPTQHVCTY